MTYDMIMILSVRVRVLKNVDSISNAYTSLGWQVEAAINPTTCSRAHSACCHIAPVSFPLVNRYHRRWHQQFVFMFGKNGFSSLACLGQWVKSDQLSSSMVGTTFYTAVVFLRKHHLWWLVLRCGMMLQTTSCLDMFWCGQVVHRVMGNRQIVIYSYFFQLCDILWISSTSVHESSGTGDMASAWHVVNMFNRRTVWLTSGCPEGHWCSKEIVWLSKNWANFRVILFVASLSPLREHNLHETILVRTD